MNKKLIKSIFFILFFSQNVLSQQQISIHYEETKKYDSLNFSSEKDWDLYNNYERKNTSTTKSTKSYTLNKEVFGWHPYWSGSAYNDYDYSLLSEISYFSYEVNSTTGEANTTREWTTTDLVSVAQSNGVKVSLTVTLFSGHQVFFASQSSQTTLINNLISLIKARNANGVNIDFEAVPESEKYKLTAFMETLCTRFHQEIPDSRISIALPAVDWKNVFEVSKMNAYVDLFLIMGYGYHWSGSSTAGPSSPKNTGNIWGSISTVRSINYYLNAGISPEKLCLAVPYYGRDWGTTSSSVPSSATSTGATVTYKKAVEEYASKYNYYWDEHASAPSYIYQNAQNQWHQAWVDDAKSLGCKYDYVNLKNIAGIGIWAMGYEGSFSHLSDMIAEKFTDKEKTICQDVFTDTGGSKGNYFSNEDWTFTIIVPENKQIEINFEQLSIDQNSDELLVFDGATTNATLLRTYTGQLQSADIFTNQTNALCFSFKSNSSVQKSGWTANWQCVENTSVNSMLEEKSFSVYPNPFKDKVNISVFSEKEQETEVFILNNNGQLLYSQKYKLNQAENILKIKLNKKLPEGAYIIGMKIGNNYKTLKLISE